MYEAVQISFIVGIVHRVDNNVLYLVTTLTVRRQYPFAGRKLGEPRVFFDQLAKISPVNCEQISGANVFINKTTKHITVTSIQRYNVLFIQSLLFSFVEKFSQSPATVTMQLLACVAPRQVSISYL